MLGIRSWGHCRVWFFRFLLALLLTILPVLASAGGPFGPPGNTDLKQIQSEIDKISSTVGKCGGTECPRMNCAAANDLIQGMINTEMALDDMLKWLLEAGSAQRGDHACKTGDRDLTDIRLKEEFRLLALQSALHSFGSVMFDLASFMDGIKNAVDPKKYPNRDRKDLVAWYDNAANIVNNLDSITNQMMNLGETSSDSGIRKLTKEWMSVKSETVDGYREIRRLREDLLNMDSRKPVDFNAHINSLGKIVGRVLKAYSSQKLAETRALIDQLTRQASAEDKVLTASYQDTQLIFERFYTGKDVLASLRSARKNMIDCMVKAKCSISSFKFYPGSYNDWGSALTDINGRLPALAGSLAINVALTKEKCSKDGDKPRNTMPNECPACQSLADDIGRKTDEQRYFENESDRITITREKQAYELKEQLVIEEGKLARARKDIDKIYQKIYKNDRQFADNMKSFVYASTGVSAPAGIFDAPYRVAATAWYLYGMLCSTQLDSELRQDLSAFMRDTWPPLIRANTLKAQIERIEAENSSVGGIKQRLAALSGTIRDDRIALKKCIDEKCPQKKTSCTVCQPKADELKRVSDELRDKEQSVRDLEARSRDNAEARQKADNIKMGNSMLALKKNQLEKELSSCEKEQCFDQLVPGASCTMYKKGSSRKEIEKQLNVFIRSIDRMRNEVNKNYGFSEAKRTLRSAMQNAGIKYFLDHSNSWGEWMWMFWGHMDENFYSGHEGKIKDTLFLIRMGKPVSQENLQRMFTGMCQFEAVHKQVLNLMSRYVKKDVDRGLAYEEYQRFLEDYYYKAKDSPEKDARNRAAMQKREDDLKRVGSEFSVLEAEQKRIAQRKLF